MKELWKDIHGYEGLYQISNHGRVKSLKRVVSFGNQKRIVPEKILKLKIKNSGYYFVSLSKNSKREYYTIHRLVALYFCKGYYESARVNHIDGDKLNNNSLNLEWCSHSENLLHAYREIGVKSHLKGKFGKLSIRSIPIVQLSINGDYIKNWDCVADAQRALGINESNIRKCLKRKQRTAYGFVWEYQSEYRNKLKQIQNGI